MLRRYSGSWFKEEREGEPGQKGAVGERTVGQAVGGSSKRPWASGQDTGLA